MTLISTIKLQQNTRGLYRVKISHGGVRVKSGWRLMSYDAYADAESKLIYKPGYVMAVPIEERK